MPAAYYAISCITTFFFQFPPSALIFFLFQNGEQTDNNFKNNLTSSAGYGVLDTTLSGGGFFYGKPEKADSTDSAWDNPSMRQILSPMNKEIQSDCPDIARLFCESYCLIFDFFTVYSGLRAVDVRSFSPPLTGF